MLEGNDLDERGDRAFVDADSFGNASGLATILVNSGGIVLFDKFWKGLEVAEIGGLVINVLLAFGEFVSVLCPSAEKNDRDGNLYLL